jgi:hypothetical protein
MGPSTCRASNIPLIYNHTTTHISPQFHVTYDEGFTSVLTTDPYLSDTILSRLYQKATWHHPPTDTASDYHFKSFWTTPKHATAGSKRAYQAISPQGGCCSRPYRSISCQYYVRGSISFS